MCIHRCGSRIKDGITPLPAVNTHFSIAMIVHYSSSRRELKPNYYNPLTKRDIKLSLRDISGVNKLSDSIVNQQCPSRYSF